MTDIIDATTAPVEDIDNWILTALETSPVPIEEVVSVLRGAADNASEEKRDEWASLVEDVLRDRKSGAEMLALLKARLEWAGDSAAFCKSCHEALHAAFRDRLQTAFVACAFEGVRSAAEGMRRLTVLRGLTEGAYCLDKTWGFGIVKRLDDFYKKVTIDFTRKRGHQLSFSYAAESLSLVGPDHLLARKHQQPDETAALVKKEPQALVKIALHSYGPLTVTQLQEILEEEGFLEGAGWKPFWDGARKGLKSDSFVRVPAKRSEPIELLEEEAAYDDQWFSRMATLRDAKEIYDAVLELEREKAVPEEGATTRPTVGGRLAFAILGAEDSDSVLCCKLMLQAERLGFCGTGEEPVNPVKVADYLVQQRRFYDACAGLSARDLPLFFDMLKKYGFEGLDSLLLEGMGDMPVQLLDESLTYIMAEGRSEDARLRILSGLKGQSASPQLLYWLCTHLDLYDEWKLGQVSDLMLLVVGCFETPAQYHRLKAQKLLKALFEDNTWLGGAMDIIGEAARAHLLVRVQGARGWEESSRRSAMGKMIKLYPELESAASSASDKKDSEQPGGRFTSWRTYNERQEALRELVEVSIPENSREIAHARSYGDLRENFEYQAAKDMQGLLMRRKAEMERDLGEVRGSDFSGVPTDVVGMGTGVTLSLPDDSEITYWILGEWDRDEELNIISSESQLALTLKGKRADEPVVLQTETGEQACVVKSVHALTDAVRSWISGA